MTQKECTQNQIPVLIEKFWKMHLPIRRSLNSYSSWKIIKYLFVNVKDSTDQIKTFLFYFVIIYLKNVLGKRDT